MIVNLEYLDATKTVSILDVVNAALKVLKDQKNLQKLSKKRRRMLLSGKKEIVISVKNNLGHGMHAIWNVRAKCLWKPQENISLRKKVEKKEINGLLFGTKITQKKEEHMIKQCMLSKPVKLLDQEFAVNVAKNANHKHIMRIIQNHLKSFGFVHHVISIFITSTNFTLREQARKHRKVMRCSDPMTKAWEMPRNEASASYETGQQVTEMWQAGGKARFIYTPPGYLNDPAHLRHSAACSFDDIDEGKSSLIDLEAYNYAEAA